MYEVDDATSGFKLLTDNGSYTISFKRQKPGCDGEALQARYYFEHNQDGGNEGWNFSISLGVFSIGYTSGDMDALQKATGVFRTTPR